MTAAYLYGQAGLVASSNMSTSQRTSEAPLSESVPTKLDHEQYGIYMEGQTMTGRVAYRECLEEHQGQIRHYTFLQHSLAP